MRGGDRPERWRWRVAATVVPVAVVLLGLTLLVPATAPSEEVPDLPGAATSDCLSTLTVRSVRDLDRWVRTVRGDAAFAGGDVGASAELQDGRQVFLFGDTLRSPSLPGGGLVRNSMLVAGPLCARVVLPPGGGAVVPDRSDGVGYWPMSVVAVPFDGYDLVGVSLQRVRGNGDDDAGVFAFDVLGPAAAVFAVPVGGTPQLVRVVDAGADHVDPERPMWGAAVARDDQWLYLYGTSRPADATSGGFALRVARVTARSLLHLDEWEFWDGRRWVGDADDAAELLPADGGVSQTLSVFEQDGTWYALSKQDEVLGTDLAVWTAPAPQGPFTLAATPVAIPSDAATGTLRYLPLAHPELFPRPGTVVVSYSENNTDPEVVRDDPRRYRPRFLRVRLPPG